MTPSLTWITDGSGLHTAFLPGGGVLRIDLRDSWTGFHIVEFNQTAIGYACDLKEAENLLGWWCKELQGVL